jgi:superfamily II DNA or RNA helicase
MATPDPHPTAARWGCPPVGDPGWRDWFESRGLGWFGRSDPEAWVVPERVSEATVQTALATAHRAQHARKRATQALLLDRLVRPLEELLGGTPPAPARRAHPVAAAVQARADAARGAIRAWTRPIGVVVAPSRAGAEVTVSLSAPDCRGDHAVLRYDGLTGSLLGDGCGHDGPCGARVRGDEAFAAWLDGPEAEALRSRAAAPAWARALGDLRTLGPGRGAVRLHRDPIRAERVDADGRPLPPTPGDPLRADDPAEVLRALAREGAVTCEGERVRVHEDDLPVRLESVPGGVRVRLPADLGPGVRWLASPPGELRWCVVGEPHLRLARWGDVVFPTAEAGALTTALRALPVRLQLPDGALGAPRSWDGRLAAQLSFDPEHGLVGGLQVALPGGGVAPVADGDPVVAGEEDGAPWELRRDFAAETAAADAAWEALGLRRWARPDLPWRFAADDLADAVALAEAFAARPDLVVTWRRPLRVSTLAADAVRVSLRPSGHWLQVEGEVDGVLVPLHRLLATVRERRALVTIGAGEVVRLAAPLIERLGRLADLAEDAPEGARVGRVHGAALAADLGARLADAAEPAEVPVPPGLRATLRDYQRDGFAFLARRAAWAPGAVLADDMGLGKTVQAIALLAHRGGRSLVVAPTSVLPAWRDALARFLPDLPVALHHGAARGALPEAGAVLTSWDLLARDEALGAARWDTVVLDEAHAAKNPRTRRAAAAAALDAGFRVALTGTPLENHLGELWSLFAVVVPGLLPAEDVFRARFQHPIERERDPERLERLRALVHPFLLRRTKAQVARELPPRTELVEHVVLGRADRAAYDRLRRAAAATWADAAARDRFALLAALTRLRQLACDGRLVDPAAAPGSKLGRLVELLLEVRAEGQRALVFSEFTSLLGLAEPAIVAAGLVALRLDGATSLAERERRVAAFQAGQADVFLLSRKAGGTGITLTAASVVIHLDPWWNPATEDQASDRAHRLGQSAPVTVVRLVAKDTLEERVLALHAEKRALVSGVLEGAGGGALDVGALAALLRDEAG